MERGLEAPRADPLSPALSLTLRAPGAAPLQLKTAGKAPPLIPRERFCALARGGAAIAASASDPPQEFPPVALSAMKGVQGLIAEACP